MSEAPRESGRFVKGHRYSAATMFRPGDRRGHPTEFRPGQIAHNRLPLGAMRMRREANTGLMRAWIKVAEPNTWRKRAVVVWEAAHGSLPRGQVVHHVDGDSLNDALTNLQALTRAQHRAVHAVDIQQGKLGA